MTSNGKQSVGKAALSLFLSCVMVWGLVPVPALAEMAKEQGCILGKQYEQISMQVAEVLRLLVAWAKSDRRRYGGEG